MLLLSLLLAAGTLIWVYAPRFGPRHDRRRIARADFAQHLAATGRFFSKQGHTELLLRDMRSAALEQPHHRIPGFKRLSTDVQAEKLAHYFDIPRETAHTFLTVQAELDEEGFRSFITLAERIRRWNRRSTQKN
jgi:hypothetical protein